MADDDRIPRFTEPTLDDLKDLECLAEVRETIRALLCGEVFAEDVSPAARKWASECYHRPSFYGHEIILEACDELLGTNGVEALEIEGDSYHTDDGIRMCSAFSYCNAGDPYVVTLMRDHVAGEWLVASWGDALDEYERDNELGDYAPGPGSDDSDDELATDEDDEPGEGAS